MNSYLNAFRRKGTYYCRKRATIVILKMVPMLYVCSTVLYP